MTFQEKELLRRFHRALIREFGGRNPWDLSAPFTVAEIYQNLVPYRTHREELGVEMNADYEHVLLRLLAGEGDYLTIEPPKARQEIRTELDSPNPNTGLYRDFAAADVRLNPHMVEEAMADQDFQEVGMVSEEESNGPEGENQEDGDGPEEGVEALKLEDVEALDSEGLPPELSEEESPVLESEGEEGLEGDVLDMDPDSLEVSDTKEGDLPPFEACPWCKESLPQRGGVKFCPFCGSNVRLVPCPACGEELELNWRFCIACGMEVDS